MLEHAAATMIAPRPAELLAEPKKMRIFEDCFGRQVRLTDERMAHILEHPELKHMGAEIERTLHLPQWCGFRVRTTQCGCSTNFTHGQS